MNLGLRNAQLYLLPGHVGMDHLVSLHKATSCGIRYEMSIRPLLEDDVSPLPRLVIDQAPLVP